MDRWRQKRRLQATLWLCDQAEDALYGLSLVRARSDGILSRSDEDIRELLETGLKLLSTIQAVVNNDDTAAVSPYQRDILREVIDRGDVDHCELSDAADEIERAHDDLQWADRYESAQEQLEAISRAGHAGPLVSRR